MSQGSSAIFDKPIDEVGVPEVQDSKKQILKSTGILGSAQLIGIVVGIVRVKVIAVLLGAVGVGISGMYQTIIDFIRSATGFGLGYSAVRDIAASAATNDQRRIARTVLVLRRWAWATGILGMGLTIVFSRQIGIWTFGTDDYTWSIVILSSTLVITSIANAQGAVLQGLRRIGDLAKANVLGAVVGVVIAVAIYKIWGIQGIIPVIFLTYLIGLAINSYFSRRLVTEKVAVSFRDTFKEGRAMASLGFFMTVTGLAQSGTMYLVRAFLVQESGLIAVGHFVAAWTISSMYLSAVFGAMSADYFPRLSAVQHDKGTVTKLVNEQAEIAVLITAPIITGMVSFIDLVVRIFYSKEFGPTATILDWQLLGDFFKVIAWALGFIMVAKGKGRLFVLTELCWNLLYIGAIYFGWSFLGIEVTGVAFLSTYVLYYFVVFVVARKLVDFKWSESARQHMAVLLALLVTCFVSLRMLTGVQRYAVCTVITLSSMFYSFYYLKRIIDINVVLKRFKVGK